MSLCNRVVYIITKLELGGAQKVCLALYQDIAKKNIVTTLISGSEGVLKDQVAENNQTILLEDFKREISWKAFFLELKAFCRLYIILRKIKKESRDVIVHTHSTKAGIVGRWAAFFAGVRYRIHTVHGFGFHDYQSKSSWALIYSAEWLTALITTHFVCVSKKDQEFGAQRLPFFKKHSSLIRAAVDEKKYLVASQSLPMWNDEGRFVIGTIACFKPQKNLLDLFRAFYKLIHRFSEEVRSQICLEIIGDGEQRQMLEEWILAHGLEKQIILHGWQNDVAAFLHTWDLFALSSLWEGLPCAVVEARLAKLPVVAYDVGGISEIIHDGINGYLVKPGDWRMLSDRLFDSIQEKKMGNLFIQPAETLQDFYQETMVNHHMHLYEKMISDKK